jgi:hypothetical protein
MVNVTERAKRSPRIGAERTFGSNRMSPRKHTIYTIMQQKYCDHGRSTVVLTLRHQRRADR